MVERVKMQRTAKVSTEVAVVAMMSVVAMMAVVMAAGQCGGSREHQGGEGDEGQGDAFHDAFSFPCVTAFKVFPARLCFRVICEPYTWLCVSRRDSGQRRVQFFSEMESWVLGQRSPRYLPPLARSFAHKIQSRLVECGREWGNARGDSMGNEPIGIVEICNRVVGAAAFPDAVSFWLGFLTYVCRNRAAAETAEVPQAMAWLERGGLKDAHAPQTQWFYNDFCRQDLLVEEARIYLHFRGLDHLLND
jgi:hypothetical protein